MARKPSIPKSKRIAYRGPVRRANEIQRRGTEIYAAIRRICNAIELPINRKDLEIHRKLISQGEPVQAVIFGIGGFKSDIIVLSNKPTRKREVKYPFSPTGYTNPEKFMLDYVRAVTKQHNDYYWYYITPTQTRQISAQQAKSLAEEWNSYGRRLVASL